MMKTDLQLEVEEFAGQSWDGYLRWCRNYRNMTWQEISHELRPLRVSPETLRRWYVKEHG